jgi:hypothetical protein
MRNMFGVLLLVCGIFCITGAQATVQIDIDLTRQSMNVTSDHGSYTWPVSTARSGYATPTGRFSPYSLQTMHYSRKYHMSPMPHSIFFAGGYAIHGTYSVAQLGRPASHGCIRLSPGHAAELFKMVKAEGASISISGTPPRSTMFAKVHKNHAHPHYYARTGDPLGIYGGTVYQDADTGMAYASSRHTHGNVRTWQADPYYHW